MCTTAVGERSRLYRNTPRLHVLKFSFSFTRARWDLLHSAAIARQSSLEESLLSLGQFEEAYDELWAWLTDALRQLGDMEPITGDPAAVAAQLAKHQVQSCLLVLRLRRLCPLIISRTLLIGR